MISSISKHCIRLSTLHHDTSYTGWNEYTMSQYTILVAVVEGSREVDKEGDVTGALVTLTQPS